MSTRSHYHQLARFERDAASSTEDRITFLTRMRNAREFEWLAVTEPYAASEEEIEPVVAAQQQV